MSNPSMKKPKSPEGTSMKKVSLVVPVYNVESYLERCLESLVNQTFQDIEILCVNDGSTDDSQAIIDEFARRYPDLIVPFQKENGGLSDARNYGMKRAQAEYITFVDSDDWVDPDWIEKLYARAVEESADIVVGDVKITDDHGESGIISANFRTKQLQVLSWHNAWNKLYKKSLFTDNNVEFPVGIWFEDLATIPRLIVLADRITHVNGAGYYYFQRPGSITTTFDVNRLNDYITAVEILYEFFDKQGILAEYKEELEFIYIRELLLFYPFKYANCKGIGATIRELNRLESIVRRRFPDFKRNRYNTRRDCLERNSYMGLKFYLLNKWLYVIALKLYVLVKNIMS